MSQQEEWAREYFESKCPYTGSPCEKWTCSTCEVEQQERQELEEEEE